MRRERHVIFDFDDTLFPTTAMQECLADTSIEELQSMPSLCAQMTTLDNTCVRLVNAAQQWMDKIPTKERRRVHIVSNATQSWIDYAMQRWMPQTHSRVVNKDCLCLSARDRYSYYSPENSMFWKLYAFESLFPNLDVLNGTDNKLVVSIGDGRPEWEAADLVFGECGRRVRCRQTPSISEIIVQMNTLRAVFESDDLADRVFVANKEVSSLPVTNERADTPSGTRPKSFGNWQAVN